MAYGFDRFVDLAEDLATLQNVDLLVNGFVLVHVEVQLTAIDNPPGILIVPTLC